MKLSVVTSMYRSEGFVKDFYAAISRVASEITDQLEIIFVDDGSPDHSAHLVREIIATDSRVRLIRLSRNFGQSVAMLAGLRKARGDLIYTSDIDLEDPPELLAQFHQLIEADGALQSVYGYMAERQGTILERTLGRIFYAALAFAAREKIPHQVWSRLMTRKFLDSILAFSEEYHLFWSGLFHIVGFKQLAVPVERRKTGQTSYNYAKKIDLAFSALTSFSIAPLQFIFLTGLLVSSLSLVGGIYLISRHLQGGLVPGWASIVLSVLFTGGITNLSIGLVGLYVGRIFIQSKRRPQFFIEEESGGSTLVLHSPPLRPAEAEQTKPIKLLTIRRQSEPY
jgi:putative glycosyltransferase